VKIVANAKLSDRRVSHAQTTWAATDIFGLTTAADASKVMTLDDLFTEIPIQPVIKHASGLLINPAGADADMTLLTVGVVGVVGGATNPTLKWDTAFADHEAIAKHAETPHLFVPGHFNLSHPLYIPSYMWFDTNWQSMFLGVNTFNPADPCRAEGNTVVGDGAFVNATSITGGDNTAIGVNVMGFVTTGIRNTIVGADAGLHITSGDGNCGFGKVALYSCSSGVQNVAIGRWALYDLTTGTDNIGIGASALADLIDTSNNIAIGRDALKVQTAGGYNTVMGINSGSKITTASQNTIIGGAAGITLTTGGNNVIIGTSADVAAAGAAFTNAIAIGYNCVVGASDTLVLGAGVNVAIGQTVAAKPLDILSTAGAQLRLTHTATTYATDFTVSDAGKLGIVATGAMVAINALGSLAIAALHVYSDTYVASTLCLEDSHAMYSGCGGQILFKGISDSSTKTFFAQISGRKANATNGNTEGKIDLEVQTQPIGILVKTLSLGVSAATLADAINLVVGSTTGTKIGTAATQKLGFWNATPIIQPTVATDATVATLITALTNIGLIKNA
jgi:hypothetical protein